MQLQETSVQATSGPAGFGVTYRTITASEEHQQVADSIEQLKQCFFTSLDMENLYQSALTYDHNLIQRKIESFQQEENYKRCVQEWKKSVGVNYGDEEQKNVVNIKVQPTRLEILFI